MADDQDKKKDRLFGDISVIQVTATALAAVTSVFLASYIGIAGSLIGTAVASVVSTVAASAYKKFMRDSAEKIKELPLPTIPGGLGKSHATDDETASEDEAGAKAGAETAAAADEKADEAPTSENGEKQGNTEGSSASDSTASSDEGVNATEATAPSPEDERAAAIAHQKKVQRGLIAVCVVSALLAVAASAAVVYLMTTGEGLGAKPSVVYVDKSDSSSSQAHHATEGSNQTADERDISSEDVENDEPINASNSSASISSANSSSASSTSSSATSSSASSSSSSSTSNPEPPDTSNGSDNSSTAGDSSDSGETTDENSTATPIAQ